MKNPFNYLKQLQPALLGIGMIGLLLTSCMKNDHDSAPTDTSALMAFNLATDRGAVSVSLGGSVLTNLPLNDTSYTGGYLGIYPGNRLVESFDYYGGSTLATVPGSFVPKKYYSVFVTGTGGNYRNVLVLDDIDSLSSANGKAYVRYVNAIPDSTTPPQVVITAGSSNIVSKTSPFNEVSEFVSVDPGQLTIDISNGTGIDADRTITTEAKKIYTILLTGAPGSTAAPVAIKYVENGTLE